MTLGLLWLTSTKLMKSIQVKLQILLIMVHLLNWKMVSKAGKPHLYDLSKDVHEDNDIAEQHPDIVKKMVEIAHSQHTESPYFKVTMPVVE